MKGFSKDKGSFCDPGGFIYSRDGNVYCQINIFSRDDFDYLMDSGLYRDLVERNLIVEHEEVGLAPFDKSTSYKVIQPTKLPFISYPYEWRFSQYQRAALATLEIQNKALDYGMNLKDASAYNSRIGIKPLSAKPQAAGTPGGMLFESTPGPSSLI